MISSKPVNILLGDINLMTNKIAKLPDYERVMQPSSRWSSWSLDKTSEGVYWNLGEDVTTLNHQFMIFRQATLYLGFNYRGNQSIDDLLNHYHQLILHELKTRLDKIRVIICACNYREIKIHKRIKKQILKFLLEITEYEVNYSELGELFNPLLDKIEN